MTRPFTTERPKGSKYDSPEKRRARERAKRAREAAYRLGYDAVKSALDATLDVCPAATIHNALKGGFSAVAHICTARFDAEATVSICGVVGYEQGVSIKGPKARVRAQAEGVFSA